MPFPPVLTEPDPPVNCDDPDPPPPLAIVESVDCAPWAYELHVAPYPPPKAVILPKLNIVTGKQIGRAHV